MKDLNIFKGEKGFADDVEEQLTGGCMVPATVAALATVIIFVFGFSFFY